MREEYNEVYGYLPQDIINKLSEVDRARLFFNWLKRKPTTTGWFIAHTVVEAMGEEFITYMINGIIESIQLDGEEPTREAVIDGLANLMEAFATDSNILYEYIHTYRIEVLDQDEEVTDEEEDLQEVKKTEEKKSPKRDAKGRFIKSK